MGQRPDLRAADQDRSLRARYERARDDLVPRFLQRHRLSRAGLADLLDVNRTALSRFLNGIEGYTPTRSRPGKIEILERIEAQCGKLNILRQLEVGAARAETGPDADRDLQTWFENFSERLSTLEEKYEPVTALLMIPELCAQATIAPAPYGASMCANLLLRIAGKVDAPQMEDASPSLLRETSKRVLKLEDAALAGASPRFRETMLHKPVGYAGYALCHLGLRLGDDALVEAGLERLLRAALLPHDVEDGHWQNLLMVLEHLFEVRHRLAETWSERVAREASDGPRDTLGYVLSARVFEEVGRHWGRIAPGLLERARNGAAEETS